MAASLNDIRKLAQVLLRDKGFRQEKQEKGADLFSLSGKRKLL